MPDPSIERIDEEVAAQAAIDRSDDDPATKVQARAEVREDFDDELGTPPRPDHARA